MSNRYEVREQPVSDDVRARFPHVDPSVFYVYDTVDRRKVPFSNSRSRSAAQRTADKLNQRADR